MSWHDLLFMHWPLKPEVLRPLIPPDLNLDTFGGEAWIGVVPFRMSNIRHRFSPALPWVSAFPELNVRTYVTSPGGNGKPGVWFFSLDAAHALAVRVARWSFHLPYYNARMAIDANGNELRYRSDRTHRNAPPAAFAARYRPTGDVYRARPGNLDHWLTERYCLYSADQRGALYRGDIHHEPWPLQPAEAEIELNTMMGPIGVRPPEVPPLLHFARRLDVVARRLATVGRGVS